MRLVIVLVVLQTLVSSTIATVYTVCTTSGSECDATTEDCDSTDLKCYCKTAFINIGDGTCVSDDCTTVTACSTNAILNSKCDTGTSKCVCDALSDVSAATDATKGACVVKDCTANGNECGSDVTIQCSTGSKCECISTHTLAAGICQAQNYGEVCSSDATCAGLSATDAVCDTQASSAVCKIAVGKTCSTTTDNCVTNGECDATTTQCKCKTNYVADSTGNLCMAAQSSAGMIAASVGALLLTLLLQVSLL